MGLKISSILIVWFACLLPYLASERQTLLARSLPKSPAWFGFTLGVCVACYVLSNIYIPVIAAIIVLVEVMFIWVALVLIASHWSKQLFKVNAIAILILSLIALTGFAYE